MVKPIYKKPELYKKFSDEMLAELQDKYNKAHPGVPAADSSLLAKDAFFDSVSQALMFSNIQKMGLGTINAQDKSYIETILQSLQQFAQDGQYDADLKYEILGSADGQQRFKLHMDLSKEVNKELYHDYLAGLAQKLGFSAEHHMQRLGIKFGKSRKVTQLPDHKHRSNYDFNFIARDTKALLDQGMQTDGSCILTPEHFAAFAMDSETAAQFVERLNNDWKSIIRTPYLADSNGVVRIDAKVAGLLLQYAQGMQRVMPYIDSGKTNYYSGTGTYEFLDQAKGYPELERLCGDLHMIVNEHENGKPQTIGCFYHDRNTVLNAMELVRPDIVSRVREQLAENSDDQAYGWLPMPSQKVQEFMESLKAVCETLRTEGPQAAQQKMEAIRRQHPARPKPVIVPKAAPPVLSTALRPNGSAAGASDESLKSNVPDATHRFMVPLARLEAVLGTIERLGPAHRQWEQNNAFNSGDAKGRPSEQAIHLRFDSAPEANTAVEYIGEFMGKENRSGLVYREDLSTRRDHWVSVPAESSQRIFNRGKELFETIGKIADAHQKAMEIPDADEQEQALKTVTEERDMLMELYPNSCAGFAQEVMRGRGGAAARVVQ